MPRIVLLLALLAIAASASAAPDPALAKRYSFRPVLGHHHTLLFRVAALDGHAVRSAKLRAGRARRRVPPGAVARASKRGTLRLLNPWAHRHRAPRQAVKLLVAARRVPAAAEPPATPAPPPATLPVSPGGGAQGNPDPDEFAGPFDDPQLMLGSPIDPWQQTAVPFGDRSHWLQPWRAYLTTPPASTLANATGINLNVPRAQIAATARLLAENGFRRARIEVGWDQVNYDDPHSLNTDADLVAALHALQANGIRPLILVNSNDGLPCVSRRLWLNVAAPAAVGDREIRLSPASAADVAPGRTGLVGARNKAGDPLITTVDGRGVATLSKPLTRAVAAGPQSATTFRYPPFSHPLRANGSRNPAFDATLAGWLDYVDTVTTRARAILGNDDFDVEIWNELSFGSDFLDINKYYETPVDTGKGDTTDAILRRTVGWLRDPTHGVSGVGIGNGFANQRPWDAGATSPVGLTAIDKHPYAPFLRFPESAQPYPIRALDAQGQPSGSRDAQGKWHDDFVPSYRSYFPEFFLTAIQTEFLIRDLSPITSVIGNAQHGRNTHPPGGSPPEMWFTETNVDPSGIRPELTPSEIRTVQAKSALRTLTAYANKGVTAVDFYAARGPLGLIDPTFFSALANGASYPGRDAGGQTLTALRRLNDALQGGAELTTPRSLDLLGVSEPGMHKQFDGDGTAAHPPLYDRDVIAFFPFQVDDHRFVVAAYVMTRDVTATKPPEEVRVWIGGVHGASGRVKATDPLTGAEVPVTVLAREADSIVVSLPATDSPRLISIDDS